MIPTTLSIVAAIVAAIVAVFAYTLYVFNRGAAHGERVANKQWERPAPCAGHRESEDTP